MFHWIEVQHYFCLQVSYRIILSTCGHSLQQYIHSTISSRPQPFAIVTERIQLLCVHILDKCDLEFVVE